ncbi:type II toxin-antitoxin system RelE/ParE family toxin [Chryseobacterium potabilaquae]|uniref:Uncharacterized protein n=1 Tax=Chryseobacterium potabilaquae TaxID=2675057 RepID=A0A6N4X6P3_9FLAO|nr:type II toxin-antitoxin system RelE/ParE family toxin [Chryseobacterium potabilaquae]CAA7196719.1 hypothetical protein CHRY9293_02794 [Chryseobacterium potabilaquae]
MELVKNIAFIHNFSVADNDENLPENLGNFQTIEEFQEYFALNTLSEHQKVFAKRYYSDEEIHYFRNEILEVAENELPEAKQQLAEKDIQFSMAKKEKNIAFDFVRALQTKINDLAAEIKIGKTGIEVPANRTYRVPYKGRLYFYTWQDNGDCVLVKVALMSDEEKEELFNHTDKNEQFFENFKNVKNKRQTQ